MRGVGVPRGKPAQGSRVAIAEVSVRPVRDGAERAEWDRLMDAHHYLGFRCLFGGGLRHVAETADGRWVALVGWVPGAFKISARDAWIGWAPEQQFRRLHLVANNTRFLILPGLNGGNLASRVLALSLRRLSADMEALRGHPVLLAETFVEPSRFLGTCYLAANWTALGETRGYARAHGGWEAHGVPKRILVRPLVAHACAALRGLDEPASWGAGRSAPAPPAEDRLRSLLRLPARGARVPCGARGAAPPGERARHRRGGQARGRAGRDGDRGVLRAAHPAPTGGGAHVLEPDHRATRSAVKDDHPPHPVGTRP